MSRTIWARLRGIGDTGQLAVFVLTLLLLCVTSPFILAFPVRAATSSYVVSYNPYAGIDWTNTFRLKTQLHCHTILSDGGNYPYTVINQYAAYGYDALGISDHNLLTWPWTNWSEYINPLSWNMVAIPNDEISMSTVHFTAPFISSAVNGKNYKDVQSALNAAIAVGGIPIIAHPWLMGFSLTTADSWTGFQGVEVYNHGEGGIQPFDFQFWDHLLTDSSRASNHIWGFAGDDSHDTGDKNFGWIVIYASQKDAASVEKSITTGSFIAVANSSAQINSIIQTGNTLSVGTSSSVIWKANGQQIVGTTNILNLDTLAPGYTYVRAEVDGNIFSQPIFITQSGSTTNDFYVSTSLSRLIVTAGKSGTATVTATLQSGTTQLVTWSISGLPTGATSSFNPTKGYPTFSSQLTISTSPLTPIDVYPITVKGSSSGNLHNATFMLDVINFTESLILFSPNGDGVKDIVYANANFGESLSWSLVAKNSAGSVVSHIAAGTGMSMLVAWSGRDDNGRVVPDGTYTLVLSESGFSQALSIAVDTKSPTVSASWTPKTLRISRGQTSTLTYKLSETSLAYIQIFDSSGNLMKTLLSLTTKQAGTYKITWNGNNDSGGYVRPGTYTCRIFVADLAGNQASPYPATYSVQVQS